MEVIRYYNSIAIPNNFTNKCIYDELANLNIVRIFNNIREEILFDFFNRKMRVGFLLFLVDCDI